MRTILAVLMALGITSFAWAQAPGQSKTETKVCTLKVTGMTCAGCEAAVKIAAKSVSGVTNVTASYAKGTANVTYDPAKATPATIAKVIADQTGYKAIPQPETKK